MARIFRRMVEVVERDEKSGAFTAEGLIARVPYKLVGGFNLQSCLFVNNCSHSQVTGSYISPIKVPGR